MAEETPKETSESPTELQHWAGRNEAQPLEKTLYLHISKCTGSCFICALPNFWVR